MEKFVPNANGGLTTAANREFVENVLADIATPDEINGYTDNEGNIDKYGIARVQSALFALAYGDGSLTDKLNSLDNNIANITRALTDAAVAIAKVKAGMKAGNPHEYDLSGIAQAANKIAALREEGKPVSKYLNEQKMFDEDSEGMREILRYFDENKNSAKKISQFLRNIAASIKSLGDPAQVGMFDETESVTLSEIIESAKRKGEGTSLFDEVSKADKKSADETINAAIKADPELADFIEGTFGGKVVDGKIQADARTKQKILNHLENLSGGENKKSGTIKLDEGVEIESLVNPKNLNSQQKAITDFGREMGTPVVFFESSANLNGIHANGITYINTNSEVSAEWIFSHETAHWLKANNPELYEKILDEIEITDEQRAEKQKERPDLSGKDLDEEIFADAFNDTAKRAGLLQQIGKKNPDLLQRAISWLKSVLDKVTGFFNNPKGGLTTAQKNKMYAEFKREVDKYVDEYGNKIFRMNSRTHEVQLADGTKFAGEPIKSEIKFSKTGANPVDNAEQNADNTVKHLTDTQKENLFDTIKKHIENYIDEQIGKGLSESEIVEELISENSRHRARTLGALQASLRDFENRAGDKEHRRVTVERINRVKGLSDTEIDSAYKRILDNMREVVDYGGILYHEIALNRRGNNGKRSELLSWIDAERQRAEREGTKFSRRNEVKHSENRGAFSNAKYSISNNDNSSEGFTSKIKNFFTGTKQKNTRENIREVLENLSGMKIRFGKLEDGVDVVTKEFQKVIRSRNAYDWEKILPEVGKKVAKKLNITSFNGDFILN